MVKLYLMQKATAVLSYPTQMVATVKRSLIRNCMLRRYARRGRAALINPHASLAASCVAPYSVKLRLCARTQSLFVIPVQERRIPPPVPKKPLKGHPPLARDRSLESSERQRLEARKRLLAAKRAASVRQSSATESADSIEIYIPEAQTRL